MLKLLLMTVAALLIPLCAFAEDLTGILGAFDEEIRILDESLKDRQDLTFSGLKFSKGTLNGRLVVVAQTGVGKVNAAMTTAILLDRFHPREVVFTGIAGGVSSSLNPGDIVIGEKVAQHDLGFLGPDGFRMEAERNPVDGKRNPVCFESDKRLVAIAKDAAGKAKFAPIEGFGTPKLAAGVIATGDIFVASGSKKEELRKNLDALAVEMEGASVGQVCYQLGVPFIVIRSLSDRADSTAKIDIKAFYKTAAANSAALVGEIARECNGAR